MKTCALITLLAFHIFAGVAPGQYKSNDTLFPIDRDHKWGFINSRGRVVVEPQFDYAWRSFEGICRIAMGPRFGYVDKSGKILVEPTLEYALDFSEGLAAVCRNGQWGYIDKTGKMVIELASAPPENDQTKPTSGLIVELPSFSNGLAVIVNADGTDFIDRSGKVVTHMKADSSPGSRTASGAWRSMINRAG